MSEVPPDWQDGEHCYRCRLQFSLVARRHHCRNCGNIFCAKCSSKQIPLPKLNIDRNVRVCDGCYDKLSQTKNTDALAGISKTSDSDVAAPSTRPDTSSNKIKTKMNTTNNKPAANASAPSEEELKEEEELQLAMALSLSETPAKFSFPEIKQFEEPSSQSTTDSSAVNKKISDSPMNIKNRTSDYDGAVQKSAIKSYSNTVETPIEQPQPLSTSTMTPLTVQPETNNCSKSEMELRQLIEEAKSTAEVIVNRVNSNRIRNRSNDHDSALQSLFLKLTGMRERLLEFSKTYDEERASYERLQDKLSEISDARAALDSLREEYQEKKRKDAEEAERQRQSQLALKLEMMREKKSQMMQYHRELALQRMQAQEMMINQVQQQPANPLPVTVSQQFPHQTDQIQGSNLGYSNIASSVQPFPQTSLANGQTFPQQTNQIQASGSGYSNIVTYNQPFPQTTIANQEPIASYPVQSSGNQTYATQPIVNERALTNYSVPASTNQQQQHAPKQEDEALLISFDD